MNDMSDADDLYPSTDSDTPNRTDAQIDALWPEPGIALTDDALLSRMKPPRAPWVSANFVSSIDGAVTVDGLSAGLGSAADKRLFDLQRRPASVILVGAGTVRAEGYGPMVLDEESVAWREGSGLEPHPVFAIVSGRLDLDPDSPIFTAAPARPIVLTVATAPSDRWDALDDVADVIAAGEEQFDAAAAIVALQSRGLTRIHCEGGPSLFGSLLAADVLDEVSLTISPLLAAGDAARIAAGEVPKSRGMALASVLRAGSVLLLRYERAT